MKPTIANVVLDIVALCPSNSAFYELSTIPMKLCVPLCGSTLLSQVHASAAGDVQRAALLIQVSPVAWQHLNFYGRYEFRKGPQAINMEEIVQ